MEHPDQPALEMTHLLPTHRSLRLAVVTETYPPEVNGVAVTVARLIEGLLLRGHEIDLVRPRQALRGPQGTAVEGLQELLMRGMPIPRYPQLRMGLPAKAALVSQWQRRRPDLVHVATEGPLGWSAVQAARKLRLPVSADFRTNFHAYSRHYGLGWLNKTILTYLRKFHNRADLTLVPTETLRKELAAMGFERLSVVGRGVDTQRFDPALRSPLVRARWGVAVDDPVVLYVGRLAAEKNLDLLIRAYQAMKQRRKSLRLVVIGEGPMADDLANQCPDALLLGVQGGLELAQSYASADIFLFPSRTETYGNVTAEALASGLAVVAFDYAAARELIINGHNGWTSGLQDEEGFVRRACEVLEAWHPGHPMRMNARRTMLSRDWSGIVEQMEERWRTLTAATQQLRTHDGKLGVMKTS
ncbi:glycosyltransferase family 4 protein [Hydrogenophaga bisanensis]|uniref:Glycosyltransferase family 4 protein n=1 Tax=Hydrogenophaga bisanensis TaxID=439611 RepID=A0ABW2RCB7_9BURK